ncbi:DUF1707 domain-containing protein [Salinigranum marinum]|uniref:DUF1707 domain-containing protein n=1 Tax=Salinigranum marinum TaxID=1515595 RepID=UPI002989D8E6|nr:DUF1707 domain-containing protein [Salinigranum marinum]
MSSRSIAPPSADSPRRGERAELSERTSAVAGLTTLSILAVAFGAMALGVPYFWVAFPVGFGGVLPVVVAYTARRDRDAGPAAAGTGPERDSDDEALDALRRQYAQGRLTDAAFERRVERLLEAETVGDATTWTRSTRDDSLNGDRIDGDRTHGDRIDGDDPNRMSDVDDVTDATRDRA